MNWAFRWSSLDEGISNTKEDVMNIRFNLNKIGPINKGEIDLNDLTVLVGMNSTGKSLIGKSAYITMRGISLDLKELSTLIEQEAFHPELYRNAEDTSISLYLNNELRMNMRFDPLQVELPVLSDFTGDITYVDGPLAINEKVPRKLGLCHYDDLKRKLIQAKTDFQMPFPEIGEEINRLIDQVIDGHRLEYKAEDKQFYLRLSSSLSVPVNRAPNGIKSFLILKELFNNGWLSPGSILILDEPEILSHPAWQLDYAHILLKLVRHFGLHVIINTCSIYFIEALEMYGKSYGLQGDFYLGVREDGGYNYMKEEDSLQKIYQALLDPYEKLDDLRLRYGEND